MVTAILIIIVVVVLVLVVGVVVCVVVVVFVVRVVVSVLVRVVDCHPPHSVGGCCGGGVMAVVAVRVVIGRLSCSYCACGW